MGRQAVPAIISSLKDSKGKVRGALLDSIPEMEDDAKLILPALNKLLKQEDPLVAFRVRRAIEEINNLPEYRRRGYAERLMKKQEKKSKE